VAVENLSGDIDGFTNYQHPEHEKEVVCMTSACLYIEWTLELRTV
jgi:hypothetical protein